MSMAQRNWALVPALLLAIALAAPAFAQAQTCAWAKTTSSGTADIGPLVVTAKPSPGYLYAEHPDRQMGVYVKLPPMQQQFYAIPNVGDLIQLYGVSTSMSGDEVMAAPTSVAIITPAWGQLKPLGMPLKRIGGGQFGQQVGVDGGYGLNNIGLLVSAWGNFTPSNSTSFVLDDGCGTSVRCIMPTGTWYDVDWAYVKVTGISCCERDASNKVQRVIKLRYASDVVVIQGKPANISGKVHNTGGPYQTTGYYSTTAHPIPQLPTHPYSRVIIGPANAVGIRLHFTQLSMGRYENLYIRDAWDHIIAHYGECDYQDGHWSPWASGSILKVDLYTSGSAYSASWGFITDVFECDVPNPLAGVTMTLQPGGRTVVTDADGNYGFVGIPAGTYTVTPSCAGMTFDPPSTAVSPAYNQTITGISFTRQ